MKTKKISWQAIAIVALALVLIASIALGVSGAWFQDSDKGNSEATMGHAVEVKLQNVDGTTAEDGVKGWANIYNSDKTYAYPGDQIIGKTQIKMASKSPALIRMSVVAEVKDSADKDVDLSGAITLAEIGGVSAPKAITESLDAYYNALIASKGSADYAANVANWNKWLLKNMTAGLNLDSVKWLEGLDGLWYYYQVYGNVDSRSTADAGTIVLFESASLSSYLTNEVAQWKVSINLVVEAIQAAHADETTHPWNAQIKGIDLLYGTADGANTTVCGYNAVRTTK